jgi:hypothetical protein
MSSKEKDLCNEVFCNFDVLSQYDISSIGFPDNAFRLFRFACDTVVFLTVSPEIQAFLLAIIRAFFDKNPNLLTNLLLLISAMPLFASVSVSLLKDGKKEQGFYQIVSDNLHPFSEAIPFTQALTLLSALPGSLALDLFHLISKIATIFPQ